MADQFKPLSRQQLAKFCNNDDEAIRFFERLFRQAGQSVPSEISTLQVQVEENDNVVAIVFAKTNALAQSLEDVKESVPDDMSHRLSMLETQMMELTKEVNNMKEIGPL